MTLSNELIAALKRHAETYTWLSSIESPDASDTVYDWSGSNVDDAYEGGAKAGRAYIARMILDNLGIIYKNPEI